MAIPRTKRSVGTPLRPADHPFNDFIGPFYDTTGLTKWLHISRRALQQRVRAASVLGCSLADGSLVYPTWQFRDDGATLPGLADVIKELNAATSDAWQIALWLSVPNDNLDGMSARDWLRGNRSRETVLTVAKHTAAVWAQ